jgi:hypothetical protein
MFNYALLWGIIGNGGERMGYIAPVRNELYTLYANRILHRAYRYAKTQPVSRSVLQAEINRHEKFQGYSNPKRTISDKHIQKLLTELTGKGSNINELI